MVASHLAGYRFDINQAIYRHGKRKLHGLKMGAWTKEEELKLLSLVSPCSTGTTAGAIPSLLEAAHGVSAAKSV